MGLDFVVTRAPTIFFFSFAVFAASDLEVAMINKLSCGFVAFTLRYTSRIMKCERRRCGLIGLRIVAGG